MKFEKSQAAVDRLTPEQRRITQDSGTERPFTGEHNDNKEPGIYVDIVSGEPLFASTDKFDSGTGWPSFTKPIVPANVNEVRDSAHGMVRTEVVVRAGRVREQRRLGARSPDKPAHVATPRHRARCSMHPF